MSDRASMIELPSLAVVIPTYQGRERLPGTLAPLLADPATTEILVVVDGSTDGSVEVVEKHAARDSRVRSITTAHGGTSAARQAGVEAARSEVILMLDDDLVAKPGLVSGHAGHHARATGVVVVGYSEPSEGRRRRGTFPEELYADSYRTSWALYASDERQALLHLWGGNVSIRREDCLRVGVHSSAFYCRYHEDAEFGIRCLKAGLRAVADQSLRASHVHRRSVDGFLADARDDGSGTMLVHLLHTDVVGPPDPDRFSRALPPGVGTLVRLCRWRPFEVLATAILLAGVNAAGAAGIFRLETNLARVVRRIQQQRGGLDLLAMHSAA